MSFLKTAIIPAPTKCAPIRSHVHLNAVVCVENLNTKLIRTLDTCPGARISLENVV